MSGASDPPDPPARGEPQTVFMPPASMTQRPGQRKPAVSAPPPASPGGVDIGAVLNGIYEIKRFIARGGMGEVYEGVNVNDDHDRVAIKVILPALAADPNVQAMFRREARTLTHLSHPSLVQYRVLAQEPSLGVFYIVTEFIDGEPLSEMLGRLDPTAADLRNLIRRMAEGLSAAHARGAVHRDISPDNILLPRGLLERAKIIDFGIVKDLDTSSATIIGDGFAGKLGYVAPEQFGDFGREIGPWTDVYSLGLVVLSVAVGRNVDMGATLVEAVDRRRAGPDLSPIPEDLRPLLAAMTTADPAQRLRSMDEVLARLEASRLPPPAKPPAAAKEPPRREPRTPAARGRGTRFWPFAVAGGATLALIGAAALLLMSRTPDRKPAPTGAMATTSVPASATPAETARRAIEAALPTVPCSWLDIVSVTPSGGGVAVTLAGVAGSTQGVGAVSSAAEAAGVEITNLDSQGVLPVDPAVCAALDAFRPLRADTSVAGRRLSTSQASYTLQKQPDGSLFQRAVITMAIGDPSLDFALYGLDPQGNLTFLIPSRQYLSSRLTDRRFQQRLTDMGGDTYRLSVGATPPPGLQGLLLIAGRDPFDPELESIAYSTTGAAWVPKIAQAARARGWKAEMVWYRTAEPSG